MTPVCPSRALVDRHFARASNRDDGVALRAHLETCADCQRHHDRHLLLAELDPAAPPAQDRIAAALGLGRPRRAPARPWVLVFGLGAATAALALFVGLRQRLQEDTGFAARGSAPAGAALSIFCTSCAPARALNTGDVVPARASLAFTYQNPTGWQRLMVLAVDDRREVYWFHPDLAKESVAVAIPRTALPRELPWEIEMAWKGGTVRVLGLFSDQPLAVDQVEAMVDATGCASLRALGGVCLERVMTVEAR